MASCARFMRDAATISIARVIWAMFRTDPIRPRMSFRLGNQDSLALARELFFGELFFDEPFLARVPFGVAASALCSPSEVAASTRLGASEASGASSSWAVEGA